MQDDKQFNKTFNALMSARKIVQNRQSHDSVIMEAIENAQLQIRHFMQSDLKFWEKRLAQQVVYITELESKEISESKKLHLSTAYEVKSYIEMQINRLTIKEPMYIIKTANDDYVTQYESIPNTQENKDKNSTVGLGGNKAAALQYTIEQAEHIAYKLSTQLGTTFFTEYYEA